MKQFRKIGLLMILPLVSIQLDAHVEQSQPMQSLRQSYYALVAMSFGPMGNMVKGKIDWDSELFSDWAEDLDNVARYNIERAFVEGAERGRTRAKPEIWLNMKDFESKLNDFRAATSKLAETAKNRDKDASRAQFIATGGTCKACHDEYKSRDYLY